MSARKSREARERADAKIAKLKQKAPRCVECGNVGVRIGNGFNSQNEPRQVWLCPGKFCNNKWLTT